MILPPPPAEFAPLHLPRTTPAPLPLWEGPTLTAASERATTRPMKA